MESSVPHILFLCMVSILVLNCLVNGAVMMKQTSCPCSDSSLCDPIKTTPKKEMFIFSKNGANWKDYYWDNITTVAVQDGFDPQLLCLAHSKGVRVVVWGAFSVTTLFNDTDVDAWIEQTVQSAVDRYLDGYNLDFESPLLTSQAPILTAVVKKFSAALKKALPYSKVTFDSAWSSNCSLFGRCYDYKAMAEYLDYYVIMAYDELKLFGTAMANDPLSYTTQGVNDFLNAGVPASKLVYAAPWYGYEFPCTVVTKDDVCIYKMFTWLQIGYGSLMDLLANNSTTGRKWSDEYQSPYFDYKDATTGQTHQIWYDDPTSLKLRFDMANEKNLYGLGIYNVDELDYGTNQRAVNETKMMWENFINEK